MLTQEFLDEYFFGGKRFSLDNSQTDWKELTYFPRLITKVNGWVNWSWGSDQIIDFCNAFDNPYPGARSMLNNKYIVTLRDVHLYSHEYFHPYCSGLIINILEDSILHVATTNGILEIRSAKVIESEENVLFKLGDRFITSEETKISSIRRPKLDSKGMIDE